MALPDPRFIESPSLQNIFLNKDDGTLLSGGAVYFYEDVARTVLKNIYQQVRLPNNTYTFVALNNPVTLTSIGTYGDNSGNDINVYLYPYTGLPTDTIQGDVDLYFIQVFSSTGVFQFSREAWPPNFRPASGSSVFQDSDNQIENPQFVEVNFVPPPGSTSYAAVVTGSGTVTNIAPDWDLLTDGSGTVHLTQLAINVNAPSGFPYALEVSSTGITSLKLRQRITNSPRILGDGFISGSFVANSFLATAVHLTMDYIASNGYSVNLVNSSTSADGLYTTLKNANATPVATTNVDAPPIGYVDIVITIPVGADVGISSVQIVSVPDANSVAEFFQESVPRQKDHLFHYYETELIIKPKQSILTGWNFRLNPWQFYPRALTTLVSTGGYIADQTVLIAEVAASLQTSGSNTPTQDEAFVVKALTGVTQGRFALIQYIDATTARPYLFQTLSSLIRASIVTSHNTKVGLKVRLLSSAIPPATVNQVTSWDANGPVFNPADWATSLPLNDPAYTLTSNVAAFGYSDVYSYNQILNLPSTTTTQTLALVVYTTAAMDNTAGTEDYITFSSVSLVPNEFAVESNPQTFDQVLRECQYFYEQSYNVGTVGPAITAVNERSAQMNNLIVGGDSHFYTQSFNLTYQQKRVNPTIVFYSPTSITANQVEIAINRNNTYPTAISTLASTNWTAEGQGLSSIFYRANTNTTNQMTISPGVVGDEAYILYHFTADARLGVV